MGGIAPALVDTVVYTATATVCGLGVVAIAGIVLGITANAVGVGMASVTIGVVFGATSFFTSVLVGCVAFLAVCALSAFLVLVLAF